MWQEMVSMSWKVWVPLNNAVIPNSLAIATQKLLGEQNCGLDAPTW